jgi:alkylation response protein AidB-like acyl-CoA dehydrogenase
MDVEPSEIEALVQRTAREFAARVLAPQAAELDATERFPRDVLRALAELGLMTVNAPLDCGGAEAGPHPGQGASACDK